MKSTIWFLAHLSYAQGELLWPLEFPSSVVRRASTIWTIFFETTGQMLLIFGSYSL